MVSDDLLHPVGDEFDGLVPSDATPSRPVTKHRLSYAVGGVDEVPAISPFDAQMPLVDRCIEDRSHGSNPPVSTADHHFASGAAIGANGANFRLGRNDVERTS